MESGAKIKVAHEFAATVAQDLSRSIAKHIGEPWPVEIKADAVALDEQEEPVNFRITFNGALNGNCYLECQEAQIASLVSKIAQQQDASPSDDEAAVFVNVLADAIPDLTKSLESAHGQVTVKIDRVTGMACGGMFVVSMVATNDTSNPPMLLYFDSRLLDALNGGPLSMNNGNVNGQFNPQNLKLIMDVELNVSLLFGRRQMPLRDLLDLNSGSVIELDRMVDEPVELLLDGKVIARGEAVVIDGNYGLRITEIPQPVGSHLLN